jgi:hypothetical protein
MQSAIKVTAVVQPGGKIEVTAPELESGGTVEIIILGPEKNRVAKRSALDILAEAPGHRLFKTTEEVDSYMREERDAW